MQRLWMVGLAIAATMVVAGQSGCTPPTGSQKVTITGFIMDNFCLEMGFMVDNPTKRPLENPELHSVHCLAELDACVKSGYAVLQPRTANSTKTYPYPTTSAATYEVAYYLDNDGTTLARRYALAAMKKNNNAKTTGFTATITGYIAGDVPFLKCATIDSKVKANNKEMAISAADANAIELPNAASTSPSAATSPAASSAAGNASATLTGPSVPCTEASLASTTAVPLGALSIKTLVSGPTACIQVSIPASKSAKWFGISIGRSAKMVSTPSSNAVIFDSTTNKASLVVLGNYDTSSITPEKDQSPLTFVATSSTNDAVSFTFSRSVAAVAPSDVAIDTGATTINWAFGSSAWPSVHDDRGSGNVVFGSSTVLAATSARVTTYTLAIAGITLGVMVLLGIIATHGGRWRLVNLYAPLPPVKTRSALLSSVVEPLADLKVGEYIVIVVFGLGLLAVSLSIQHQFNGDDTARHLRLISGHLSLVSLMFVLLPVARGEHWEWIFGISHERILKFHRMLGRLFVVMMFGHLILTLKVTRVDVLTAFGTQEVVPLYGFIAFVSFASMSVLAIPIVRRRWYELFLYHHRLAAIIGLVFALLHSQVVRFAMLFPLTIFGFSLLLRVQAFFNRYQARVTSFAPNSVVMELPATKQTKDWVHSMNPCAFFWINVPSVSLFEWHPFSAIITPDGQSIAFCIKAQTRRGFVDKVVAKVHNAPDEPLTVLVNGPYGKPAVNLALYDEVILVAGGIGITPMLNLVNRFRVMEFVSQRFQLHWAVRHPQELLTADSLMFATPFPDGVKAKFYASQAMADGSIANNSSPGGTVAYVKGRPVMEEILYNSNAQDNQRRVCVLACGPPALVQEAQIQTRAAGLDFHKEVFLF
ncbi:unnamed protein product [Aphanomyces euteiches]|uniref:DOMON domain-containing protein n=2 Tax=Aphanomyces euteiches TaxID=100861 RepID=A0A6G0WSV3_9STRA|nr:hypothetical protein Ae201684_011965 [Aphanomyces euteiches]KAH9144104.1 hypothetical protein AeRB84_011933 [Aphanomyces euteiches]